MAKGSGLASSSELRSKARAFLEVAATATIAEHQLADAVQNGPGFHFTMGVYFAPRAEVLQAQHELIKPVLRKLGGLRGNEQDLRALTWRHAGLWVMADEPKEIAAAAQSLLREMEQSGAEQVQLYLPNYTFRLASGVEGISLGKVDILPSTTATVAAEPFAQTLRVSIDGGRGVHFKGGLVAHFPEVCWRVRLNASPNNVREEGAWLIDVAISLARMLHRPWRGLAPDLKDWEPNSFEPTYEDEPGFSVQGDRYGAGAMNKARYYLIDETAASALMSERCQTIAGLIFDPPPGAVAERVAQGLGWLTRARRARDKSEAFLHFFTALEALFSGEKGQPVTATISRYFAVLWSDDTDARRTAAKWLSDLYDVRSALVHTGRREAIAPDVRNLHHAADRIFRAILLNMDLAMPTKDFAALLRDASYGSPWPHRVPMT